MKNTKINAVKQLMDADKNISVKEICEKTGFSKSQVYVIRNVLKKKKLTRVNKTPSVSRVRNKPTDKIRKLVAENAELNRWCLEWREKSNKQEKEIARLQHLYMDQLAVVRYLESKIQQLFKE
jgi:hypothetical protein